MLPNRIVLIAVLLVYHTRTTSPLWRPCYDRYPPTITDIVRYYRLAYVIQKYKSMPYRWYWSLSVYTKPMYLVITTICVIPLQILNVPTAPTKKACVMLAHLTDSGSILSLPDVSQGYGPFEQSSSIKKILGISWMVVSTSRTPRSIYWTSIRQQKRGFMECWFLFASVSGFPLTGGLPSQLLRSLTCIDRPAWRLWTQVKKKWNDTPS